MLVVATGVKRETAKSRSTALHHTTFFMCFKNVQNNCRYECTHRRVNVFEIRKMLPVFSEVSVAASTLPRLQLSIQGAQLASHLVSTVQHFMIADCKFVCTVLLIHSPLSGCAGLPTN
jgi:hypothetical protein